MTVHYRELMVSQEATLLSVYIWKYKKLDGDTLKNRSIRLKPSIHVNLHLQIMCKKNKLRVTFWRVNFSLKVRF